MKDELFAELLESVRQGGAILRGKRRPSRAFRFKEPNVRAVRKGYGLSQAKFAALMGISAGTLRNWEQDGDSRRGLHAFYCVWSRDIRKPFSMLSPEPRLTSGSSGPAGERLVTAARFLADRLSGVTCFPPLSGSIHSI